MMISELLKPVFDELPDYPHKWRNTQGIAHAPRRPMDLNAEEQKLAVANALRYVPQKFHRILAKEFVDELHTFGHIYAFRYMPDFALAAPAISDIPAKTKQAAAIVLMILNNLDPEVAQFPQELVTYGGNGQVFSNWIQFRLVLHYLTSMTDTQTLALYSGHPLGLFPAHKDAPRVVITNGMMIPNYSTRALYDKFFALGVTMYGQMTAGSFCYIGPQGIVHGTTITIMNAGRKYLGLESLAGKVFVTAGLGGMSGAQPKAAKIAGCIGVIAEISEKALKKRHAQGWLEQYSDKLDEVIAMIKQARAQRLSTSIGYLGNVVDLWERLAAEPEDLVELGSDQTSCHNPFLGGYYPAGISFDEANVMMTAQPAKFKEAVQKSLRRQIAAIDKLTARGMHFWDYGNAFLVECQRSGAPMLRENARDDKDFRYPSYFQDIMGDIFSMGFGPFRWVCTSGKPEDLRETDRLATEAIARLSTQNVPEWVQQQYADNSKWILEADRHQLVVGSQARILYSDQAGRIVIAAAFNQAVKEGVISAPVVISRDHHDVSGTDSPFRETANVGDGSAFTADMAVQNCIGDADADRRLKSMLAWDVSNGVARRCWSGNAKAKDAILRTQRADPNLRVTLPADVDDQVLAAAFSAR